MNTMQWLIFHAGMTGFHLALFMVCFMEYRLLGICLTTVGMGLGYLGVRKNLGKKEEKKC